MKPVYQTIFAPPHGNCFAACVASIFEVDLADVPNLMHGANDEDGGAWFHRFNAWLRPLNLRMDYFTIADGDLPWAAGWTVVGIKSPRGQMMHCVVFEGQEFRHDPIPDAPKFRYTLVLDLFLFYPIDPARPAMIPRSNAYADQHDSALDTAQAVAS